MRMKGKFLRRAAVGLFFFLCLGQGFCVHAGEAIFDMDEGVYLIQSAQDMRTLALLVNGSKEVEPGASAHSASYRLIRDIVCVRDSYTGELLGRSQEFPLEGVFLPEGASGSVEIQNCLTGGTDIMDFQEFMEKAGQNVWFCAADHAYPNLFWEKESRFGYAPTVTGAGE